MEPARPRSPRRRPRRGSVERPVNAGLVRGAALVLVAPLMLLAFTVVRSGPLPAPDLPAAFDETSALALTRELSREHPIRVPGSPGAAGAVRWYHDKLALYGLSAKEQQWEADVAGLGSVGLSNLVTVVPGTSPETIVVVSHRDNDGRRPGANDNASGTASLIELVRQYARTGTTARRPTPLHTLVFVSTDAGSYGALGAERFARTSPLARRAVAVLSLDALAGPARPRIAVEAYEPRSPGPALVRTVSERVREQTGAQPAHPSWLAQLVGLGIPFGYGEQASFLAAGRPAVSLGTVRTGRARAGTEAVSGERLGQLGRAAEATLASLDGAVGLSREPAGFVYLGDRALRGWALELVLVAALVPFAVAVVDLLVRSRRLPLASAWRAQRRRTGAWLTLGALTFAGAVGGIFPRDTRGPPAPDAPPIDPVPIGGLALLAGIGGLAFLLRARRASHRRPAPSGTGADELAGLVVALTTLGLVAAFVAVVNAYALVFVLPSLYSWLWLAQLRRRRSLSRVLFGLGLAGPVLAVIVLGDQLDLGLRAPLYAVGLATAGVVPWTMSLAFLVWAGVASHVASFTTTRYSPPAEESSAR